MDYPRRSIPSMSGLIAFEATARHLSFSRAADDLALTQGAVSKRVRQLEAVLGFQLLVRNTNQVCLTEVGENYLTHVRRLLQQLQASTEDIRATARGKVTIRVAVPAVFATRWLVPRLTGFTGAYPNYAVDVLCACTPEDPRLGDADCAIFEGLSPWGGAQALPLASSPYIVVASPSYLRGYSASTPQALAHANLLGCNRTAEVWGDWFSSHGHDDVVATGATFDDLGVLIEAAIHGQGVALVPAVLVVGEIASGRLVQLFSGRPFRLAHYTLSLSHRVRASDAFTHFGRWLAESGNATASPDENGVRIAQPPRGGVVRSRPFSVIAGRG